MTRTLFLCAFLVGGCASQMPAQPAAQKGAESAGDPVTDQHTDPDTDNPSSKAKRKPSSDASTPGAIPRAELAKVLDASPGYFLQHVQTEPRFTKGHFHGWRLVSFYPGDARFSGVDLQAGDVVTRVNGKSVEQPDQFMAVWTELRSAHELVVDVERAGKPRTLRWTIADK